MPDCDPRTLASITDAVRQAYESVDEPKWHKINEQRDRDPYRALLRRLACEWEIQDTSDENDDVCLYLALAPRRSFLARFLSLKKPSPQFSLLLSFVGPFAVLLDHSGGCCDVVSPDQHKAGGSDRIMAELRSHSILPLDAPALEHSFSLSGLCKPGQGTVFQVLFDNSNSGQLPWRDEAKATRHAEPGVGADSR